MLSNFLRPVTPEPRSDVPLRCRAARHGEINDALKLILSNEGRPAGEVQVVDFLRYAVDRGINLTDTWVAERDGRIVWATLPVLNPGRTMLLLVPDDPPTDDPDAPRELLQGVCDHFGSRGITLAQALVEPSASVAGTLVSECGFLALAELVYLQADARRARPATGDVAQRWRTYSPDTHATFASTVLDTYADSQDCPALNGMRDIDDILTGHKSAGDFRADLWMLSTDADGLPTGVVLLSPIAAAGAIEIVYLGVRPAWRGRGVGAVLVRKAMSVARSLDLHRLTLAVDSRNAPALRLYYGHGMHRICSKIALMRDLRGVGPVGVDVARHVTA